MIDTIEKIYDTIDNTFCGYRINYQNSDEEKLLPLDQQNFRKKLVPLDEANTDYQAIQEWIADGGTVIDNGGGE